MPESRLILVVEDHPAYRTMVQEVLEDAGHRVIAAADGNQGLALAQEHLPELILTDGRMPGLTGVELITKLRADTRFSTTPIIVLTAMSTPAETRAAMNCGADDYITKPVNANDLLRSVNARLEKRALIEELDAFAHTVAHDLRSPIAMAMGRIDLAEIRLQSKELGCVHESLEDARDALRRLNAIVDEMLLLASVRKATVQMVPLDMAQIVGEALHRADAHLRDSLAQVQQPESWPRVTGYGPWIVHVWFNLLTNAAKYGGAPPRIELSATPYPERRVVRFVVRDHGPGVDPQKAAGTLTPFSKIPQNRGKGHGLGLSIVQQIITKLDGACGVKSTPGEGAAFWFELPAAEQE